MGPEAPDSQYRGGGALRRFQKSVPRRGGARRGAFVSRSYARVRPHAGARSLVSAHRSELARPENSATSGTREDAQGNSEGATGEYAGPSLAQDGAAGQ